MTDTVLITGGLGYIGGRIATTLVEHTEYHLKIGTRQSGVTLPKSIKRGDIVSIDMMSDNDLFNACKGVKCVIHLAGMNEIDSLFDPERAIIVNSLCTLKLLNAAQLAGVEKFIYFSTAHVYGSPLEGTITEKTITRSIHPYAITHRTAEDFVLAAHDQGKIQGIVLRLSNGFGSPAHKEVDRWTLISNDLCRQAVTVKKLVLKTSGLQKRDFITLFDVGQVVLHFLRVPATDCKDGLFNVGGESSLRIIDLAHLIAERCEKVFGFQPQIFKPEPLIDESSPFLDYRIDKLKETGFILRGDFNKEIDATLIMCDRTFGT
jgi:UDP-glucose 4-epimerase